MSAAGSAHDVAVTGTDPHTRPLPRADEVTAPYWGSARDRTLRIQHCAGCDRFQHPPQLRCATCGGSELTFRPVSGLGRVNSYTVVHDSSTAGFRAPYVVALVELVDQDRLILVANLVGGVDGDDGTDVEPYVGMPVTVCWEPLDDGIVLPQFQPVPAP